MLARRCCLRCQDRRRDASRHWLRARLEQRSVRLSARLVPDADAPGLDADLQAAARERPRQQLKTALAAWLPAALAAAVPAALGIGAESALGRLRRDERRRVVQALQDWPLPVRDSRGYGFAEVTAGGVPAREVDAASMGSRPCPGAAPGRRDPGRGRAHRGLQFPVGVVLGLGCGAGRGRICCPSG